MKYFNNINTIEELKKEYKKLAMKYHPDINADGLEEMKIINNEYEKMFELLSKQGKNKSNETVGEFKDIINEIIKYNINIDIVGTWVWVFGESTKEIKDILKGLGFKWGAKKKKWFWYSGEYKKTTKTNYSYEDIKNYYGFDTVKKENELLKLQ